MLRDFCLAVGLSLEANDYKFALDFNFSKNDPIKPEQLTFSPDNIVDFFPVIMDYLIPSDTLKPSFKIAEAYYNQGNYQSAFDKYKGVIILSHEIHGPINKTYAICHRRLATISFLEKDIENAILLTEKAIIVYEKLGEFDTPTVANCYSELATYYISAYEYLKAFKCMIKAWEIAMAIFPKNVR